MKSVASAIQGPSHLNLTVVILFELKIISVVIEEVVHLPSLVIKNEWRLSLPGIAASSHFANECLILRPRLRALRESGLGMTNADRNCHEENSTKR